jgi:hypothetical protein
MKTATYMTKQAPNVYRVYTFDWNVKTFRESQPMSLSAAREACALKCAQCNASGNLANVREWSGGCGEAVCKRCHRSMVGGAK